MGGNAIPGVSRLTDSNYKRVAKSLVEKLQTWFPTAKFAGIPSYTNKPDHGDLDILYTSIGSTYVRAVMEKHLQCKEVVTNGPVFSVGYNVVEETGYPTKFQIDFIQVPEKEFDFALKYFSYNDLGNLIGQTARGIGLKFGHEGLFYKYMDGTYVIEEILITRDFDEALRILDYDPEEYKKGFDSLDDIFAYTITSSYFSTWNYLLENRNHVGRIRDKKRKTYMQFVDWINTKVNLPNDRPRKFEGLGKLMIENKEFAENFIAARRRHEENKEIKAKFNGDLVREWIGLDGIELGKFIAWLKEDMGGPETFKDFMYCLSPERIQNMVKTDYERYSKSIK